MEPDAARAAVSCYFRALASRDTEAWLALFARNGVRHDASTPRAAVGRESLRGVFDAWRGAFDELEFGAGEVFVYGPHTAVSWTAHAVGRNARAVDFQGIEVIRFDRQGRIRVVRSFWDPERVVETIHAPAPRRSGDR